jgi:hypothetical protein
VSELFSSGRAADVLIAFMAVEAALLILARNRLGRGLSNGEIARLLLPGLFLALALRTALTGAPWYWTALMLLFALGAHIADLWGRWASSSR